MLCFLDGYTSTHADVAREAVAREANAGQFQGQHAPPWVQDVCSVLQQHGRRATVAARVGPRGTHIYVVQWALDSSAIPSSTSKATCTFGFLGDEQANMDDQQPYIAAPIRAGPTKQGLYVLVDAPSISINQPHTMSIWAAHLMSEGDSVILYTQWGALEDARAKAKMLLGRIAHTA